ncbi:MAG TPA: hypothetical protein VMR96_08135 [Solirubrobacterales bacterium]|nr:hypothetical protein [Solirubrobacterales bacterium]
MPNETAGPVTVEAEWPAGINALRAAGSNWDCTKTPPAPPLPSIARCTRSDALKPGGSYPKIELIGQVSREAADSLTTSACASGGDSVDAACQEDTVSGILPVVPFGFKVFETKVLDEFGDEYTQAGGHPFSAGADIVLNEHMRAEESQEIKLRAANGYARDIHTELPPGFSGNPEALGEKCETVADVRAKPSTCPASSIVGGITLETSLVTAKNQPIYAIEAEEGTPAQMAFAITSVSEGFAYTLTAGLRPQDNYAIDLVASPVQKAPVLFGASAKICAFGAKSSISSSSETKFAGCRKPGEAQALEAPFTTLPTRCGDPESSTTRARIDTWEEPGNYAEAEFTLPTPTGCNALGFAPTLEARPTTTAADSPSGFEVDLHIPQNEDPESTATAHLKKTVVTLPEGLVINPSSANGLAACTQAQLGMVGGVPNADPVRCPDAAKIGSVTALTPVLDHPLGGTAYVAAPHENPFGTLLGLYLVIDDPQTGTLVKLAGKVEANPNTGRLTTTFDNNPQLPVEDVKLNLRGGATAPLRTPATCNKYSTTSSITPWSAPESGPPETPSDAYKISKGPGGGACAAKASAQPNKPSFSAGTASPIAASYSPMAVHLRREDGSQEFSSLTVTPPPGLIGRLAGLTPCSDGALAAAGSKTGVAEQASPSCPASAKVGTATAGAGAGPAPYYATGNAYLAGPYKGAPISLAFITPAVAGPFDLGTIVVRTAVRIDPETARVTAESDPIPHILEGIPLDIRTIDVALDRPNFTLNPTSCDPMSFSGSLRSTLGSSAALSDRFQLGECSRLAFKPKLSLRLFGRPNRGAHPAFRATLTMPPGGANIAATQVALPRSEFIENAHFQTICTRVQFAASQCPAGSIYGHVRAISPLVDYPLEGPVYLRSSSHKLPDLVMALRGPASQPIEVDAVGRVDSVNGGIRTTFESTPDAPLTKLVLNMAGGKKGLFVNSRNICKTKNSASATFTAHNGKSIELRPPMQAQCGKAKKKGKGKKQKRRGAR